MVIYKTLSIRTIIGRTKTKKEKKNRKWRNLSRTDLQPAEHCKSMVVSGSHWNLLICYDIVLYMVWNTDSFPLDWFCSLNLFLCLCLFITNLVPCKFRWPRSSRSQKSKFKFWSYFRWLVGGSAKKVTKNNSFIFLSRWSGGVMAR